MAILKLKILAEDIKLDNYISASQCPITRALARAGRPDLKECCGIYKRDEDGSADFAIEVVSEKDYTELTDKMFSMYKTIHPKAYPELTAIPIEDIDWEFNIPETFEIDADTVKATQTDFVEKK